jgi:cysteinyl-tRNA synthetase
MSTTKSFVEPMSREAIGEITEPVTKIFMADRDFLRIKPADDYPRATDYIRR